MRFRIITTLLLVSLISADESSGHPGTIEGYTRHRGYGWSDASDSYTQLMTLSQAAQQCKIMDSCTKFVLKGTKPETTDGKYKTIFLSPKSKLIQDDEWTAYVVVLNEADTCDSDTCNSETTTKPKDPSSIEEEDEDDDDEEDEFEDPNNVPSPESEKAYSEAMTALFAPGDDNDRNITLAAELFTKSSNEGHSDAQFMLGLLHSLGLGVRPSEMMAVLYYTFSAMSGNADAALALSYRYNYGYGVPKSCVDARKYYKIIADKVARSYCQHAISPAVDRIRLSDPVALRTRYGY